MVFYLEFILYCLVQRDCLHGNESNRKFFHISVVIIRLIRFLITIKMIEPLLLIAYKVIIGMRNYTIFSLINFTLFKNF